MTDDIIVPIAAIYASVVAISYRKIGILPALIWPVTIVCVGMIVFLATIFAPEDQDPEK